MYHFEKSSNIDWLKDCILPSTHFSEWFRVQLPESPFFGYPNPSLIERSSSPLFACKINGQIFVTERQNVLKCFTKCFYFQCLQVSQILFFWVLISRNTTYHSHSRQMTQRQEVKSFLGEDKSWNWKKEYILLLFLMLLAFMINHQLDFPSSHLSDFFGLVLSCIK